MRIEKTFTSFTGQVGVGRLAYFIKISKSGAIIEVEDICNRTIHFPRIVLYGEPFFERDEVPKVIKRTLKYNPETIFQLNIDCKTHPKGLGPFTSNIIYNVNVKLKYTGLDFYDRINNKASRWFIETNGNFIFDVRNEDDVDEVTTLVSMLSIPKRQVFLSPYSPELINFVIDYALKHRYGIAPNFRQFLWNNVGRVKEDE